MYINSLGCFRIDSGLSQGCSTSPGLFNVHMDAVMMEVKVEIGKIRVTFLDEGREWLLPGLLHADDLKEDLGELCDVC